MDNEQPATDMSDEDFTAALKRLQSHADDQAQKAFHAGDLGRYEVWRYRHSHLNALIAAESMKEDIKKLRFGSPKA